MTAQAATKKKEEPTKGSSRSFGHEDRRGQEGRPSPEMPKKPYLTMPNDQAIMDLTIAHQFAFVNNVGPVFDRGFNKFYLLFPCTYKVPWDSSRLHYNAPRQS